MPFLPKRQCAASENATSLSTPCPLVACSKALQATCYSPLVPGGDEAGAAAAAQRRAHLAAALAALRGVVEAHARLAALFASRSALQPLLNCIEPACRCGV